jgi:putative salt-induced outer membrane protein YdiY
MPLRTADLHDFADWMIDFEAAYRAQRGNGNAAALAADAAQ